MKVYLSTQQAREIRKLLRRLDQPVPVDLVSSLGIADPYEYITYLRKRFITV